MYDKENYYRSTMTGIKLYPTIDQANIIDNYILGYKMVYNWALSEEQKHYEKYKLGLVKYKFLSSYDLIYMYSEYRKSDSFLNTLKKNSMNNAICDLVKGYESFFKHKNLFNKPQYKNLYDQSELISSYKPRYEWNSFYFEDNLLRIEGQKYADFILTSYHTGHTLQDKIHYKNPIIFRNNRTKEYWLKYTIELPKLDSYFVNHNIQISEPIGVDVNKNQMYACSNGIVIHSVDISRKLKKISDLDKKLIVYRERYLEDKSKDPQVQMSSNYIHTLEERRKVYNHITNIYKYTAYNGSLEIIKNNPSAVILESLDVKNMMSKHWISKELQFYPLRTAQIILEQQCFKYRIPVIYAPRDFQSSNICSRCGFYKNSYTYSKFVCPKCGITIDRDINAAINLKNWYLKSVT